MLRQLGLDQQPQAGEMIEQSVVEFGGQQVWALKVGEDTGTTRVEQRRRSSYGLLDGTLRLSQASHTFGDELLLPPTGFDVPCLLPKLHLSTGSQNTEQTRAHHCESYSDVLRSQVLPKGEYTHR